MPKKNENYIKDPVVKLAKLLLACQWKPIGTALWEKGTYRLLIDEIGIFLFRLLDARWVRTHGLAFNDFQPRFLTDMAIRFTDKSRLNLGG